MLSHLPVHQLSLWVSLLQMFLPLLLLSAICWNLTLWFSKPAFWFTASTGMLIVAPVICVAARLCAVSILFIPVCDIQGAQTGHPYSTTLRCITVKTTRILSLLHPKSAPHPHLAGDFVRVFVEGQHLVVCYAKEHRVLGILDALPFDGVGWGPLIFCCTGGEEACFALPSVQGKTTLPTSANHRVQLSLHPSSQNLPRIPLTARARSSAMALTRTSSAKPYSRLSRNIMKRNGDSTAPCETPSLMTWALMLESPNLTLAILLLSQDLTQETKFSGTSFFTIFSS